MTHTNLVKLQAGYVGAQVCIAMAVNLRMYFYVCLLPNHKSALGLDFGSFS